jgi:hypothetical protein
LTRRVSRAIPSDAGSARLKVEVVRGALFKRIEEEKGLGGWTLTLRRGIRTVGIPDSAIKRVRRASYRPPGYVVAAYLADPARQGH